MAQTGRGRHRARKRLMGERTSDIRCGARKTGSAKKSAGKKAGTGSRRKVQRVLH